MGHCKLGIGLATLVLALGLAAQANEEGPASEQSQPRPADRKASEPAKTKQVSTERPLYKLPKVGKPRRRVSGGRRGVDGELPQIYALVPDHVGFTRSAQPSLYWFLSERAKGKVRFELTLLDDRAIDPLVEVTLEEPTRAGLQSVRLADYGVELEPGREYQWVVVLVPSVESRSQDVVSTGWVERVPDPEGVAGRLAAADPEQELVLFGEAGLWYDLLGAAVELAARNPGDERYEQRLAQLLEEVGLPAEAARSIATAQP